MAEVALGIGAVVVGLDGLGGGCLSSLGWGRCCSLEGVRWGSRRCNRLGMRHLGVGIVLDSFSMMMLGVICFNGDGGFLS
jgi:hypothetical protein